MANMPEVKPCPFCGSPASVEEHPSALIGGVQFAVGCDNTEILCPGYQSLTMYNTKREAITAWNKRPSIEPELRSAFIEGFEMAHKTSLGHIACWASSNTKRNLAD